MGAPVGSVECAGAVAAGRVNARLPELGAMVRAYDADRRVKAHIPIKHFDGPVEVGAEVTVKDGPLTATGRVVALVALVDVDLGTTATEQHPGQGTLS